MRKYGKLIVAGIMVAAVFLIYIVGLNNVNKNLPRFTIQDVQGDRAEMDSVHIDGNAYIGYGYAESDDFVIENGETIYNRDAGLFYVKPPYYSDYGIEKLQEKYPSFMRGKYGWEFTFYEDEEVIAYADSPYSLSAGLHTFKIDVLNKASDERNKFTVDIPGSDTFWWIDVSKVIVQGDDLFIIASADPKNQSDDFYTTMHYVYKIDLSEKKLIADTLITDSMVNHYTNGYKYMEVVHTDDYDSGEVILQTIYETYEEEWYEEVEMMDDESGEYVEDSSINHVGMPVSVIEVTKYNLETNQVEVLVIENLDELGLMVMERDGFGYFASVNGTEMLMSKVNLDTGIVTDENLIDLGRPLIDPSTFTYGTIKDDKLYFTDYDYWTDQDGQIYIIDLEKASLAYHGEINLETKKGSASMGFETYINKVYVD